MGATTPSIIFKNRATGQNLTLSAYYAGGDAAGYIVPIQGTGTASAGSPKDFVLPPGVWDLVHITGPATGKVRFHCNGQPGPIAVDMATLISMIARNITHGAFRGGTQFRYSIVVEVAMAA